MGMTQNVQEDQDNGTNLQDPVISSQTNETEQYTLDDAIEHIGFGKFQVIVVIIVGLSWMADAMEMMVFSILSPILLCEWNLSNSQEALITTMALFGQGLGCGIWGYISDQFGRKKCLYLSACVVLLFGILTSQAPSLVWMLIFRFCVGVGAGGWVQTIAIVIEVMPSASRGRCIIVLAFFWALGAVLTSVIAVGFISTYGWRWYLLLITAPILLLLPTRQWLPESPRYLLTTNQYGEVVELLHRIAKTNGKQMLKGTLIPGKINTSRGRLFDLFRKEWCRTITLLLILWFTSAFTYYGIILFTTKIFETGIDGCHPHYIATKDIQVCKTLTNKDYIDFMLTSVAELPGLFITVFLIEWIGRKKSLALLLGATGLSVLLLCICSGRVMSVIYLFAARGFISGGFPAVYVYTPEILPTSVRAVGVGACNMFAQIGAMITPFVAEVMINKSFYLVVVVYVTLLFLCVIAALMLPIETKGRFLTDVTTSKILLETRDGYERLS